VTPNPEVKDSFVSDPQDEKPFELKRQYWQLRHIPLRKKQKGKRQNRAATQKEEILS
jgi:hypothetical protein